MTRVKPPKDVSAAARKLWHSIYDSADIDAPALPLLDVFVQQYDRMVEAREILKRDGVTVKARFDQVKVHPAVQIEVNAIAAMGRCWRLLGFDQAAPGGN